MLPSMCERETKSGQLCATHAPATLFCFVLFGFVDLISTLFFQGILSVILNFHVPPFPTPHFDQLFSNYKL